MAKERKDMLTGMPRPSGKTLVKARPQVLTTCVAVNCRRMARLREADSGHRGSHYVRRQPDGGDQASRGEQ